MVLGIFLAKVLSSQKIHFCATPHTAHHAITPPFFCAFQKRVFDSWFLFVEKYVKCSCGKQRTGRIENTGPTRPTQRPGASPDFAACEEVIACRRQTHVLRSRVPIFAPQKHNWHRGLEILE